MSFGKYFLTRCNLIKEFSVADIKFSLLSKTLGCFTLFWYNLGAIIGGDPILVAGEACLKAGPSIVLGCLLAGGSHIIHAMCFAELGIQCPRAGGIYTYIHVTLGDIWAFFAGIGEVIALSLVVAYETKGFISYLDWQFCDSEISTFLTNLFPWWPTNWYGLSSYVDIMSAAIICGITCLICFNIRLSTSVNMVIMAVATTSLLFMSGMMLSKADISNWTKDGWNTFFVTGIKGTFKGMTLMTLIFSGFESLTKLAEESVNPARDFPRAEFTSTTAILVIYTLFYASFTLMIPYSEIDSYYYAIQDGFDTVGLSWMKYIATITAMVCFLNCALCTSLKASRLLYALACENHAPRIFQKVCSKTKTPFTATITVGAFSALLGLFCNTTDLMDLTAIVALLLLTGSLVALTILRYTPAARYPLPVTFVNEDGGCYVGLCANNTQSIETVHNEKDGFLCFGSFHVYSRLLAVAPYACGIIFYFDIWYVENTYIVYPTAVLALIGVLYSTSIYHLFKQTRVTTYQLCGIPLSILFPVMVNMGSVTTFSETIYIQGAVIIILSFLLYLGILYYDYRLDKNGEQNNTLKCSSPIEQYESID